MSNNNSMYQITMVNNIKDNNNNRLIEDNMIYNNEKENN